MAGGGFHHFLVKINFTVSHLKRVFLYLIVFALITIIVKFYLTDVLENQKSLTRILSITPLPITTSSNNCTLPYLKEPDYTRLTQSYNLSCENNLANPLTIKLNRFVLTNNLANCSYQIIRRLNDFNISVDSNSVPINNGDLIPDDYFLANCKFHKSLNRQEFSIKLVGLKARSDLAEKREKISPRDKALDYNVVMLAFDSISRISFQENLPELHNMFTREMNGVVLKKHNIIGDGTAPNIIGVTNGEAMETLKVKHKTVDDFPLIFKYFQSGGYMTLFLEDSFNNQGIYQKELSGFNRTPPIDHYYRPFYLENSVEFGCKGSLPSYKMYFNLIEEMWDLYGQNIKKFPFLFQRQCCRDNGEYIQAMEKDLIEIVSQFKKNKKYDNTILILMSSSGQRFNGKRLSTHGRAEERLPYLGIYLPEKLQKERPELLEILRVNSNRLTSHFDIYATLLHILGIPRPDSRQSMSLLDYIPYRSCDEAGIAAHWCMCNPKKTLSTEDEHVASGTQAVIERINQITQPIRNLCARLELKEISKAEQHQVNDRISRIRQAHAANRSHHYNETKSAEMYVYIVTFITVPGDGIFESIVRASFFHENYEVRVGEISRINEYAPLIECLPPGHEEMNKFCICKDSLL